MIMSKADESTVAAIEAAIAECKDKIRSIETALKNNPQSNQAVFLQPALRTTRNELALLEQQLDAAKAEAGRDPATENELRQRIAVIGQEIEETDAKLKAATGTAAENLAVSCRFLQMELHHLQCELADLTRPPAEHDEPAAEPAEDSELTELRRSSSAKSRIIDAQNQQVAELTKCLRAAEARLDSYEGGSPAAGPRVTVEAERLQELKNQNRALIAENEDLKAQNSMLNHNIATLTGHCKNMDEHADDLQQRLLEAIERNQTLEAQLVETLEKGPQTVPPQ